MMTKLIGQVLLLTGLELVEARKNNEYFFHSPHEGYGVISEELDEALEESGRVVSSFSCMLPSIRKDDSTQLVADLIDLEERARLAACEFIQVAAMARKMCESLEAGRHEEPMRS